MSRTSVTARAWLVGSFFRFALMVVLGAGGLLRSPPAAAALVTETSVPEALRPWVPWVLSEVGSEACLSVGESRPCIWPGRVELHLGDDGGEFEMNLYAERTGRYRIVGEAGAFPADVQVDSVPSPISKVEGFPFVELARGYHKVSGKLEWPSLPETLDLGGDTAWVELWVHGKRVELIRREGGRITVQTGSAAEQDGGKDGLELTVFRRISDGVFLTVETRILFQVSGRPRDLVLPAPLALETFPLALSGDLAVALEPNGRLKVGLVPGRHELSLVARALPTLSTLRNPSRSAPWPSEETWTFHGNTELRSLEVRGAPSIDTSRTDLPEAWRKDSAYLVTSETAVELITTRRGEEQVRQNQVDLKREFWLDETAQSFTVVDRISGNMNSAFRLELEQGELGAVRIAGEAQLITLGSSGRPGIELRETALDIEAVSRVARAASLGAVGWSEDAHSLEADMHLPPGWDVFMVSGADDSGDTWVDRWDLFDVFYVVVVVAALARLAGPVPAAIAAIALVLGRERALAPEYLWLPWIALAALVRFVEAPRLKAVFRTLFTAWSVLMAVLLLRFSVREIRYALYPHLDESIASSFASLEEQKPSAPSSQEGGYGIRAKVSAMADANTAEAPSALAPQATKKQLKYRPEAVVQTGPGVPQNPGRAWHLSWSGPVLKTQELRLYLMSPGLNAFLTLARLASAFGLFFVVLKLSSAAPFAWLRKGERLVSLSILLVILGLPGRAQADDQPSTERLAELKARLTKKADCEPDCTTVPRLELELGDELVFRGAVHMAAAGTYRLPGPANLFSVWQVREAGREVDALRLEADGVLVMRLERGVHPIEFRARLLGKRATVDIGTIPEQVTIRGTAYAVTGVSDRGVLVGRTLTFQEQGEAVSEKREQSAHVPPYFVVDRAIEFGVVSKVTTKVERVSQAAHPEVLRLTLLPFERVITPGLEVKDGALELSFAREEMVHTFESNVVLSESEGENLALSLQPVVTHTETWSLRCGVVYNCSFSGLVPSSHADGGQAVFKFFPWPGETLKVNVRPTRAAPGDNITVRSALLRLAPGLRASRGELEFEVQTSRALVHSLTIPLGAKVERATVDGVEQPAKLEAGKLRLSLEPGTHAVSVHWQDDNALNALFHSAEVNLGVRGVNFRTVVDLPQGRWILAAGGPRQGPALLFWGYLGLIVVLAWILPRVPTSPLRARAWLLLGLGLTQVPAAVAVFIGGWFFAVASRRSWPKLGRFRYNLLKFGLTGYSISFVFSLLGAVYAGLVSSPDMSIQGAGSYGSHLAWYSDRSDGGFAPTWVFSVSPWFFRGMMLLWSLWLASSLLNWIRWAWGELQYEGFWMARSGAGRAVTSQTSPEVELAPVGIGRVDRQEGESGDRN